MNKHLRYILECAAALEKSGKTFEEIYSIIFSHSDNVLAEYPDDGCALEYTYAQAKADIELVAKGIASSGRRSSFIALYGDNCKEWIVLFWAILASGNKPYLVNLKQPMEFSARIMDVLEIDTVVCVDTSPDFGREVVSFQKLMSLGVEAVGKGKLSFADEFALSSSGTTLCEKICIYSGEQICAQLLNVRSVLLKSRDIVGTYNGRIKQLALLPFYHVFGLVAVYLWYALWGSTFVFVSSVKPQAVLSAVRMHKVTHIFAVPLLWHSLEKAILENVNSQSQQVVRKFQRACGVSLWLQRRFPDFGGFVAKKLFKGLRRELFGESVRFCISGGSSVRESSLELINALGYTLCNGYGMTEIGIASVELSKDFNVRIKGSVGLPFDSIVYSTEQDKLYVKGDSVCKNIIVNGEPEKCTEWFDTGDLVRRGDDGGYYICGRVSDVVVSDNGENLNPDLAESVFMLSNAKRLSVLGDENNERLMLVVQIEKDLTDCQKLGLLKEIQMCNSRLPDLYKVRLIRYTYDDTVAPCSIKISRRKLRQDIASGRVKLHSFEQL